MAVEELSAVAAGLADVRSVVAEAKARLGGANGGEGRQTVLFLDEIHRFNRTQQHVEAVGMPECRIALAQVTRYCAEAPKSRQAFDDIEQAMADVRDHGTGTVPTELINRKATARPDQGT
ncbi:MAG: replication-associated recombination protein RarA [Candidatus Aldehydirespiratoraceae bacterium]|jgi:replication-associated recombination protein RarA